MTSVPEIIVGKTADRWTFWDHLSVRHLSGVIAMGLFLLPWVFRGILFPGDPPFWPGLFFVGLLFSLIVMILASRGLPPYVRKRREGNGNAETDSKTHQEDER